MRSSLTWSATSPFGSTTRMYSRRPRRRALAEPTPLDTRDGREPRDTACARHERLRMRLGNGGIAPSMNVLRARRDGRNRVARGDQAKSRPAPDAQRRQASRLGSHLAERCVLRLAPGSHSPRPEPAGTGARTSGQIGLGGGDQPCFASDGALGPTLRAAGRLGLCRGSCSRRIHVAGAQIAERGPLRREHRRA